MDEDWLPDVKEIISGDFNVLIDLTGDSDSEVSRVTIRIKPGSSRCTDLTDA